MENKLKKLFDYQKFERDPDLEELINKAEGKFGRKLTEEELVLVNAAGDPDARKREDGNDPSPHEDGSRTSPKTGIYDV